MGDFIVSYRYVDQEHVRAFVDLAAQLKLPGQLRWDETFDVDRDWVDQFRDAVAQSDAMLVFWCRHTGCSFNVSAEIAFARSLSKRIVLVLLDETPVPAELAGLQAIDVRRVIHHESARIGRLTRGSPPFLDAQQFARVSARLPGRSRPFKATVDRFAETLQGEVRDQFLALTRRSVDLSNRNDGPRP